MRTGGTGVGLNDWLRRAAVDRPDHVFLESHGDATDFSETLRATTRAAAGLAAMGVRPGDRVALWAGNDRDSIVAMLAIGWAGATTVLLNRRLTGDEAADQIARAGARLIVGEALPEMRVPAVRISDLDGAGWPDPTPPEPAWIVFTSGSGGAPKGVRLTSGNLEASARASALHLRHRPEDRWLAVLPICHVGGAMIVARSLREATTVVLEPRFAPDRLARRFADGSVTLASVVPSMLFQTFPHVRSVSPELRAVLLGGGPVPPGMEKRAAKLRIPLLPSYGMTETSSQVATAPLSDAFRPEKQVTPIPGAVIDVDDAQRIRVRGPMVSPGYLDEPDRDEEWFTTGDLGTLVDGALRVIGRADDVIVTGGENVHPAEVERAILATGLVDEVIVTGYDDPMWGRAVGAVYRGASNPEPIEAAARERLAGFKVPRRWVRVDEIPRLSVGKPDTRAASRLLSG